MYISLAVFISIYSMYTYLLNMNIYIHILLQIYTHTCNVCVNYLYGKCLCILLDAYCSYSITYLNIPFLINMCFPFPLFLAVLQCTAWCKCLCTHVYFYSLDEFREMAFWGK